MASSETSTGLSGRMTVNLEALARNWRALDKVSPGALTAPVLKADAYGIGLEAAGKALEAAGARFFFVATPDEGVQLRAVLSDAHIFVLNGLYPGAARLYLEQRLMPVLGTMPALEEWLQVCTEFNEAFPAALHFDTGMNRLGFQMREAGQVRELIDSFGYLPQMVMSHLACADQPNHEKNRTQLALFQSVLAQFPGIPASLANSAGLINGRDYHYQMVRPGISLYGGRAVSGRPNPMTPVVRLDVPVLQVRTARTGETVGYGATQLFDRDTRLAILAIGYGDGFPRSLSANNTRPGGWAAFDGHKMPVAGRISMDTTAVDITELRDNIPKAGDLMEIIGPTISVDDQADAAGTIGYELLTSLKGRYTRSYAGGSVTVKESMKA